VRARRRQRQLEDEALVLDALRRQSAQWRYSPSLKSETGLNRRRFCRAMARLIVAEKVETDWDSFFYSRPVYRLSDPYS
jgi:hypothetical protein